MTAPHVVQKVGALVRALARHEPDGATTSDLARASGLTRPTTHRLLTCLADEGLVDRELNGRWVLGPEQYLLGVAAARRYDVTVAALASVRRLAEHTEESAFFSARRGDETICLIGVQGSFPIRSHVLGQGVRLPLGVGSAGLSILAFRPEADIDSYLMRAGLSREYGPDYEEAKLRKRIDQARVDGYSVSKGLVAKGSWGMSAAVFDEPTGEARWALTITGVERRLTPERQNRVGRALLREAHLLSRRIRANHSWTATPVAGE